MDNAISGTAKALPPMSGSGVRSGTAAAELSADEHPPFFFLGLR